MVVATALSPCRQRQQRWSASTQRGGYKINNEYLPVKLCSSANAD
jgi:hypothetical protein